MFSFCGDSISCGILCRGVGLSVEGRYFLRGRWGDALAPGQRLLGLQEEEGRPRNVHHKLLPGGER